MTRYGLILKKAEDEEGFQCYLFFLFFQQISMLFLSADCYLVVAFPSSDSLPGFSG